MPSPLPLSAPGTSKYFGFLTYRRLSSSGRRSNPVVSAPYGSGVALHGTLQDLLCTGMHHPIEVVAVNPVEIQRHQCCRDSTNGLFGERNMIRNTAHEREGLPVQIHDGYVCRTHDALAFSARRPMQH